MADEHEKHESAAESLIDKITDKFHGSGSSSSDSDNDGDLKSAASAVKAKIYRLFGREKPVHKVLGGGKRIITAFSSLNFRCGMFRLTISICSGVRILDLSDLMPFMRFMNIHLKLGLIGN